MTRGVGVAVLFVLTACNARMPAPARQAITGGNPEPGHAAVGAVQAAPLSCGQTLADTPVTCTGTLVAPRVLLTAAHCLDSVDVAQVMAVTFAPDAAHAGDGDRVRATDARIHPQFQPGENDVALLLLAADAPVAPMTLDLSPLPDLTGQLVTVVGFGDDGSGNTGTRRSGTARVSQMGASDFTMTAAPAMTCGGDSGGPAFFDGGAGERLVGITSYGDTACTNGTDERVDVQAGFLQPILDETAATPPPPRPTIDPAQDSCALRCTVHADCPIGMACTAGSDGKKRCALAGLPAGHFGATCTSDDGTRPCVNAGAQCRLWVPCDAGGCSLSGRRAPVGPSLLLPVLLVLALRRARRMARRGLGWALMACVAGCGGAPPTHLFDDISEDVLPGEAPVPTDPTDDGCGTISTCLGATFGVGAAAADVDGDGRVDLYLAGPSGGRLYLNRTTPGGPIALERAALDVPDIYVHGAAFGDFDGDGLPELALATAGGLRMLWNANGQLADVPALAHATQRASSVTVADFDGDGLLDLHLSEYGVPETSTASAGRGLVLIGRGGQSFEDAATAWPGRHAWSSLAADLDRDGQLDLFVASETWGDFINEQSASIYFGAGFGPDGLPRYDDSANAALMQRYTAPMGIAIADVDGDGSWEMVASLIGPSLFLRSTADPRRLDGVSYFGSQNIAQTDQTSWGALFGDFDRDGNLELLMVGGAPCLPDVCSQLAIPAQQLPQLFTIAGNQLDWQHLQPVPAAGGLAPDPAERRNGRGVVALDLDGDGVDELVLTPFADRFRVYRSALRGGHRLRVALHGHLSAPIPWGAEVIVQDGARTRHVPLASGGSTHSQSEAALTIELSDARADQVTVRWPSGLVQTTRDVPAGRLDLDEPIALTLARRQTVGTAVNAELRFADGRTDASSFTVTASDGAPVDVAPAGAGLFRLTHPGLASAGLLSLSFTVDGNSLTIVPRVTFTP